MMWQFATTDGHMDLSNVSFIGTCRGVVRARYQKKKNKNKRARYLYGTEG